MAKKRIRLTESQLYKIIHNVIRESVSPEGGLGLGVRNLIGDPTSHDEYNVPDNIESNIVNYNPRKVNTQNDYSWDAIDDAYADGGFDPSYWNDADNALDMQVNNDEGGRFDDGSIYNSWYDKAEDERNSQLAESKLARLVENTVRRYVTEAINGPGTLSNMATTMISDNAAALRQFGSVGEVKKYIEAEVNALTKTSKEQKYRFLYGDGSREYGGLMGAHSMNEILQILGHMALGGNGLGLTKLGLARSRR